MIVSDLTTKMIEKFMAALIQIEDFKNDKEYDKALRIIDATLSDIFRLNLKSFNSLQDEYLLEIIKVKDIVDAERCTIISILLEKEAEILEINGDVNKCHLVFTKALSLILEAHAINNEPELIKFYSQIPILIEKINDYEFSETISLKLFKYYEDTNNFGKSEDIFYDLLQSKNKETALVNLGISFYERLLEKDSEALEKGGLPREEVQAALEQLQA